MECIPYEREKAWARECESSLLNLSTKSQEIATMHDSICNGVGKALVVELFLNKRTLQLKLKELETSSELASEYTLRLEKNYNKVVDRVAETSRQIQGTDTSMFGSSNALEACRGLDELWRDQAEFIPAMINEDQKLQSFMETLGESKTDISTHVHAQLRSVSTMQSEIRDLGNTLGVLKDALSTQCEQFTELQHLHLLPGTKLHGTLFINFKYFNFEFRILSSMFIRNRSTTTVWSSLFTKNGVHGRRNSKYEGKGT